MNIRNLISATILRTNMFNIDYIQNKLIHHNHHSIIQGADVDPFHMPLWRKVVWTIFFFIMVATADIGNIIGNIDPKNDQCLSVTKKYKTTVFNIE